MLLAVSVPPEPGAPLYWRREFDGRADQVRHVRVFAAQLLAGFPSLDDVLLVLDELAVNAVRHTRSGRAGAAHRGGAERDVVVDGERAGTHRPRDLSGA